MIFKVKVQPGTVLLTAACTTIYPIAVQAQIAASAPSAGAEPGSFAGSFIPTLFALFFVLALAWGSIWLLKRIQGRTVGDSAELKFIQAMAVGQKERVVVIEYNKYRYLLGVAASGVSLLEKTAVVISDDSNNPVNANRKKTADPQAEEEILTLLEAKQASRSNL
jgi:flagellar protein FliO/FliZ